MRTCCHVAFRTTNANLHKNRHAVIWSHSTAHPPGKLNLAARVSHRVKTSLRSSTRCSTPSMRETEIGRRLSSARGLLYERVAMLLAPVVRNIRLPAVIPAPHKERTHHSHANRQSRHSTMRLRDGSRAHSRRRVTLVQHHNVRGHNPKRIHRPRSSGDPSQNEWGTATHSRAAVNQTTGIARRPAQGGARDNRAGSASRD